METKTKHIPNMNFRWNLLYLYQTEGVTFEDFDMVRGQR